MRGWVLYAVLNFFPWVQWWPITPTFRSPLLMLGWFLMWRKALLLCSCRNSRTAHFLGALSLFALWLVKILWGGFRVALFFLWCVVLIGCCCAGLPCRSTLNVSEGNSAVRPLVTERWLIAPGSFETCFQVISAPRALLGMQPHLALAVWAWVLPVQLCLLEAGCFFDLSVLSFTA